MSDSGKRNGMKALQQSFRSSGTGITDAGHLSTILANENGNVINSLGAGGGVSSGGYSNVQGYFTATPGSGNYEITLSTDTLNGVTIDESNFIGGVLKVYDTSANEVVDITLDAFTWTSSTKVLDIENCAGAIALATDDLVYLVLTGPDKAYNSTTDSDSVTNLNLDSTNYDYPIHLIEETNIAADTYRVSLSGLQHDELSLMIAGSGGVTFSLLATNDETADTTADTGWVDITADVFSGATVVDSTELGIITGKYLKYMIKYITSDTTNAVDVHGIRYNK